VEIGMILGCHFSIGWNDGIDFINGMMEWFYKKINCIVYVLKHIESIIVLWIVMYNKKLITIIKCLDWLQGWFELILELLNYTLETWIFC
jgi:hypothetical protein